MVGSKAARNLFQAAKRRISPLHGLMRRPDYWAVRRAVPFTTGDTVVRGKPVRYSDSTGLLHSVQEVFGSKVYQFKSKTDTPHIIDAGANIGLSVLFFKDLYPKSTIIAYEPDAEIFQLLQRNVGQLPGVELRKAAAWTEDTTLSFFREKSLAGSVEMDFLNKGEVVLVSAERLRDQIRRLPVDFLKIDIEGAENAVLFDIADDLDQVDHLFFEYHSSPNKPQMLGKMLELVTERGFRYAINGTHGPALPFVEKVPFGFDLQLNVFCFRD